MKNNPYFITVDFESDWGGRSKECHGVELMTQPVLDLLAMHNAQATFFISTETLGRTSNFVKMIEAAGHEIGSHGHEHDFHYDNLSRKNLFEQVSRSKKILEDLTGKPVLGFRTPYFKKNELTEDVLAEAGYLYDSSSVNASLANRYKTRQYEYKLIPEIAVSSLYGRLPAGIKWMNLTHSKVTGNDPKVVYVHLFDLVPIKDMIRFYPSGVSKKIAAFYLARIGSPLDTLADLIPGSRPLSDLIKKNGDISYEI